jgi:hypothetical protein
MLLVPALAAALALAGGCGSDEEANDYVDEVNALQTELVDEVSDTVSGASPTDPDAAGQVFEELSANFEEAADEFEAVEPPEDVADLHDRLVTAIRDVSARIGDAGERIAGGSAQQAAAAAVELQQAATELQTELNGLIDDINARLQG